MANLYVIRADGTTFAVTPSVGITAISDAGAVTLGGAPSFTNAVLTTPRIDELYASGGTRIALLTGTALATNYFEFRNATTGNTTVITTGGDSNAGLKISANGVGVIQIGDNTNTITLAKATTLSAALTYGGVTLSNAVTGTGNMVLATSPTLTTPVLGAATGTSLALGGATIGSNALAVTGHILFEGVTSTGATGTGKFVFDSGPTITNPIISAGGNIAFSGGGSLFFAADGSFRLLNSGNTALPVFTMGLLGGAASTQMVQHKISSIADATATRVLRITVPNAAHSACIRVMLCGSIGAGGAIGANEASETISYNVGITRTAGVAMNAVISTAYGDSTGVAVVGATTITVTAALTLNAEGVGVSNTADVKVTITKGGGASANHTCLVFAEIVNANSTGITIAP